MPTKEILREILLEQRDKIQKTCSSRDFVGREQLDSVKEFAGIRHAIVITGIRRCGKSVFLSQIINGFYRKYYYVNFEDERLADFELKDFNLLYETCLELFGKAEVFFLDEVQNVAGWEKWVRRMYDDGFKFFITGSNARLLGRELGTLLTGRHLGFSIYPFSFREALKFHRVDLSAKAAYLTEKRAVITRRFREYLKDGGFPEHLRYRKIEILQEYFNNIIDRDIVERYNVANVRQLKEIARYLLTNTANPTTYNKIRKLTELKSVNTVIKYLSYLENAYLLFRVPYFGYSLKQQAANPFKVYAADTGMRNAMSFTFSKDIGRIFETVAAIELKRRNEEIYYWKNPRMEEVDFVVKKGTKVKRLIQACYDVSDMDTKEREVRALIKAGKELKCDDLTVLTNDYSGEEKVKWFGTAKKIKFVPLWKWLLSVGKDYEKQKSAGGILRRA